MLHMCIMFEVIRAKIKNNYMHDKNVKYANSYIIKYAQKKILTSMYVAPIKLYLKISTIPINYTCLNRGGFKGRAKSHPPPPKN